MRKDENSILRASRTLNVDLFTVFNSGPECFPGKRAAEFAMMTLLAVSCSDSAQFASGFGSCASLSDMLAAGAMAAFASHINELRSAHLAPVTAWGPESDRVATDTIWIGIRVAAQQWGKSMGMPRG